MPKLPKLPNHALPWSFWGGFWMMAAGGLALYLVMFGDDRTFAFLLGALSATLAIIFLMFLVFQGDRLKPIVRRRRAAPKDRPSPPPARQDTDAMLAFMDQRSVASSDALDRAAEARNPGVQKKLRALRDHPNTSDHEREQAVRLLERFHSDTEH